MTSVSDKWTVEFWNKNFKLNNFVKVGDFATAFAARFQNGEDDFPVYSSHILFTIVDHFIARRPDLKDEDTITTKDLQVFVGRFGSLKTSVDTICENFLDPVGEVHMWYHFDVTEELINRKLLTERNSSFAVMDSGVKRDDVNHKNNTYSGDLVLRLHKISRGKKSESIEKIKDISGKVSYGSKVVMVNGTPKVFDKAQVFQMGLLEYLKDRTKDYVPLQSQLWVGCHSVEEKQTDGTIQIQLPGVGGSDDETTLSSELKSNIWKPYVKPKTITKMTYVDWQTKRGERLKVASTRYRHWQSSYVHAAVPTEVNKQPAAFDSTRYVKGTALLQSAN